MKPDQIITQIAASSGITPEQAQSAFMATVDYMKTLLPDSVGGQLTGLMNGQEFNFNTVIGDKFSDMKEDAGETLDELKEGAREKIDNLKQGAKGLMDKLF